MKSMQFIFIILGILITLQLQAQADSTKKEDDFFDDIIICPTTTIPEFPGGENAVYSFIRSNLKYPVAAQTDGIEGKVILSFCVMEDGSVADVEIERGFGYGFEEEAIRVILLMPKWKPGTSLGKPVRAKYVIPIDFKIIQGK